MLELLLSRTFIPGNESSIYGTFAPGSENVVELSLPRAKKSWNFHSQSKALGYNLVIYIRRFEIAIYYTHVFRVRPS